MIKNPENLPSVANDLYTILEITRIISILLKPILPDLSNRISDQLGITSKHTQWKLDLLWGKLEAGSYLPTPTPVMNKIDINEEL